MRILLLIPGMSPLYNDNYYAYKKIADKEECSILALSVQIENNKSPNTKLEKLETDNRFQIIRFFNDKKEMFSKIFIKKNFSKIMEIVNSYQPDVIVCSQQKNIFLASKIKNVINKPIILIMEFAYDKAFPHYLIRRRLYLGIKIFGCVLSKIYWNYLCKKANAIITCNPLDEPKIRNLKNKNTKMHYVPWPTKERKTEDISKNDHRMVFAGSFTKHKNLAEFLITVPKIIERTHINEFYIIGKGKYGHVIEKLKKGYGDKIVHIESLPREKVLEIISSSFLSYSPVLEGGWGFILDSWAMKTPVIFTCNHFDFKAEIDSIFSTTENIHEKINLLRKDSELYNQIINNGYKRYKEYHDAEYVGGKYFNIFKETMNCGQ